MSLTADNCMNWPDWQIGWPVPQVPLAPMPTYPQPAFYPAYPWVQPQIISVSSPPDVSAFEARIADLEKQVARLKRDRRPRRRRI